ncbi:alpha/beta hydrolase [Bradyrhizobium sp. LA6.7]|uniref:alpha/beta fold hydrolase n=1 Tax=unclassified Bradyrhizobium TaxID=2631580 RepID=UPI0033964308
MTMQYADVNGIKIAYGVRGSGPPLVLIMGYRLSSLAWPLDFIEALAERFTVVLFDNRGTGTSDKPTFGYEISNMARDVSGLLDHLEIARANILGYSMGGAIAQEFVRQFPDRVLALALCATMCGGPRAVYASPSVVRVMRELDGLKPEEIARRIWTVTYSPGYLENHRELAEDQMRREIAAPTPLHAADLQYQAFAEFDCSSALANIKAPTLVLTGDLDELVSPQNSKFIAGLIQGASLIVIPGCGHRMMWEATDECVGFVTEFLTGVSEGRRDALALPVSQDSDSTLTDFVHFLTPAVEFFANWPWMLAGAGFDSMTIARQSIYFGGKAQFGDGKPIILVPELSSNLPFLVLSNWLKALGYRSVTTGMSANVDDRLGADLIRAMTQRVGRKAVLVTTASGMQRASAITEAHKDRVSDIVVLNASHHPGIPPGIRSHFISSGWSLHLAMAKLPQVLRDIRIELIEASIPVRAPRPADADRQLSAAGEPI